MQLHMKRTQLRIDWLMLVFPIIAAAQGLANAIIDLKEASNHEN